MGLLIASCGSVSSAKLDGASDASQDVAADAGNDVAQDVVADARHEAAPDVAGDVSIDAEGDSGAVDSGQADTAGGCKQGDKRCSPNAAGVPQVCGPDGKWADDSPCGGGTPECNQGVCTCSKTQCNASCVDTQVDQNNCGTCGNGCTSAQVCAKGKCLLRDGESCATDSACASNLCPLFYFDADKDGYGDDTKLVGRCSWTTAPTGYVAQKGDCCDRDGADVALAAKINPGAGLQSTSAGGLCGITWDYNCSGNIEQNRQRFVACGEFSAGCPSIWEPFPESVCGTAQSQVACGVVNGTSCGPGSGPPATITCK